MPLRIKKKKRIGKIKTEQERRELNRSQTEMQRGLEQLLAFGKENPLE